MAKTSEEFFKGMNTYPMADLMPCGAKSVKGGQPKASEKIGYKTPSSARAEDAVDPWKDILAQLGLRRAIGYGRDELLAQPDPKEILQPIGFLQHGRGRG